MDSEEILDLVDGNDQVIGQIKRGDVSKLTPGGGKYVRAVDVFIMHEDGRIWVPVRSAKKSIAPGGLDYSVGGHVPSGESYEAAVVRELQEETGIDTAAESLELIGIVPPDRWHFSHLYLLRSDQEPRLSDEHTSGNWMMPGELQDKLENGAPAKESLLANLKRLQQYLDENPITTKEAA